MTTRIETDVLVIGGGGAGFRAAIAAGEGGAETLLLSKGPLARCGATPMAGADYTLVGSDLAKMDYDGEPRDTPEKFFNDVLTHGFYLNNRSLCEQYIGAAATRLEEMLGWGWKTMGSEERAVYGSGLGIMDTLLRRAKAVGVAFMDDVMVLDLTAHDGRVTGALGLEVKTGEFLHFAAKAVVIATGGWHKGFWPNTGMRDLSGDGIAMACRAGAAIGNMEFITYCANVLYEPPNCRGSIFPYILHIVAGGALTNSDGELFLDSYHPVVREKGTKTEWDKCFISYASAKEVRAGRGSPLDGVYYGLGEIPYDMFLEGSAAFFPNKKYKALDLSEVFARFEAGDTVQVGPAVEYFIGGIVVNDRFETDVRGLYAAGECTLGPFGANRVCSAITEMLVHGADAGVHAAEFAAGVAGHDPDPPALAGMEAGASAPLERGDGLNPAKERRVLQERAHRQLGPIRTGDELVDFLDFLETVKRDRLPAVGTASGSRAYNKQWFDALEMENLVLLLEAATRSAIARTESRGTHFREDYPDTNNDSWMLESITTLDDGELKVTHRPVDPAGHTPPAGVLHYEEMLKRMMAAHSDIRGGH